MNKAVVSLNSLVFDEFGRQIGYEIPAELLADVSGGTEGAPLEEMAGNTGCGYDCAGSNNTGCGHKC